MIYLDSNVIIRFIEGAPPVRNPLLQRLKGQRNFLTSQLSRLECRCDPLRAQDRVRLAAFDGFFATQDIKLIEINTTIIDHATNIRAIYGLKSPDAIHLATSEVSQATLFLTGDIKLSRFAGIKVELI